MTAAKNDPAPLHLTRDYKAPRDLVFEAFSKAEHLEKWFVPDGFKATCSVDFRVGGTMNVTYEGMGMKSTTYGTYRAIVEPERIEWVSRFEDIPGHDVVTTIVLTALDTKTTRLEVTQSYPQYSALTAAEQALLRPRMMGAPIGWGQTLDHLTEFLAR